MNIGIIGAGNISGTHARAAESIAGTKLVAVWGDNAAKAQSLARMRAAVAYESLERFLAHRPMDAVFIGSPSGLHADHATAAVRHGLHVLVEKPLDISTTRIDGLLDEVERAGVTLGVFFQDRLKPDVLTLKHLLDSAAIGVPALASGQVRWYRPPEYYAGSRWRGTWSLDGGGALMNQGIHTIDLLLYLLGDVTSVSGVIATRFHDIEAEDTAAAILQFASGITASVEATTAAFPGFPRRVEIVGSGGTLLLDGDSLVQAPNPSRAALGLPENVASPAVSDCTPHQRIIEDFLDAVQKSRPPVCDGREARRSVAVVEAVYRSFRERRTIDLR